MNLFSRLIFGLAFCILVIAIILVIFFPQNMESEVILETLGQDNREILDSYLEKKSMERQRQMWLFLGGLLLITFFLTFYFYYQFVQPFFALSRSLAARDISGLEGWTRSKGEFGEMARLMARYLRQGKMLQEEIRQSKLILSETEKTLLLNGKSMDREKLARDLHDGIIQSVYGVGLEVGALRKRKIHKGNEVSEEDLLYLEQALGKVVKDIRSLIIKLEPSGLRDRDLVTALNELGKCLERIGSQVPEMNIETDCLKEVERNIQVDIYWIVRELISNALRHAHPKVLSLQIKKGESSLEIDFCNDGVSRNPSMVKGSGLKNIESRLMAHSGKLDFHYSGNSTFEVHLSIPFRGKENT